MYPCTYILIIFTHHPAGIRNMAQYGRTNKDAMVIVQIKYYSVQYTFLQGINLLNDILFTLLGVFIH